MQSSFRLAGHGVDPALGRIQVGSVAHRVEPKVMAVLCELAGQPGQVVARERLLAAVWPHEFVSEGVLSRAVHLLRGVFSDDPRHPRFIETIPCRGYRLIAVVTAACDEETNGAGPDFSNEPHSAAKAVTSPFSPTTLGRDDPPLIGRSVQLGRLQQALARAEQGLGALWMLSGESGVGKTRLAREVASLARSRGFQIWLGHCSNAEGAPRYEPWVEILDARVRLTLPELLRDFLGDGAPEMARLLPELRNRMPGLPPPLELPAAERRRYLSRCWRELLARAAGIQPILLVLDDIQWTDEASLHLLEQLAIQLNDLPVLIVGTCLDEGATLAGPLSEAMDRLLHARVMTPLMIPCLSKVEVRGLLEALSGRTPSSEVADIFFEETEGNPFFVTEVYRHFEAEHRALDSEGNWRRDFKIEDWEIPATVRAILSRRLDRLSPVARRTLQIAAVIGRRFRLGLLQTIAELPGDLLRTIEEAERLSFVETAPTMSAEGQRVVQVHFRHELVRQTLLAEMGLPRRQLRHHQVVQAIKELYCGGLDSRARQLAHHLDRAGTHSDKDETARYLDIAGRQAFEAGAFAEALDDFERALDLVSECDAKRRGPLIAQRARAQRALGR